MSLKELLEKRAAKQADMKAILDMAKQETRSLTEEENTKFSALEKEIRELDATINAIQTARELELEAPKPDKEEEKRDTRTQEQRDYDAFDAYIRGVVETRDDPVNMTKGANGAVIPASIANKIIEKVVEICPIYHDADRYNVKGTLSIPYYDETTQGDITVNYADEFSDGLSTSGKFASVSLTGFLARAITDVSKSLINNSQFDVVDFVVNRMAKSFAKFLEKELINGTSQKIEGLSGIAAGMKKTLASKDAITADELIDIQEMVPDAYQADAYWIMNKATRTAIRKLKDGQNNYLLNKDANSRWGYTLFGKDVYTSANVNALGTNSKTVLYYGDMKGLAVKVSEDISIDVLREVKARQHVVEVLGFAEVDAKVQNAEMLACAVTPAAQNNG
jgi:HK97 family phage major capsid protein